MLSIADACGGSMTRLRNRIVPTVMGSNRCGYAAEPASGVGTGAPSPRADWAPIPSTSMRMMNRDRSGCRSRRSALRQVGLGQRLTLSDDVGHEEDDVVGTEVLPFVDVARS